VVCGCGQSAGINTFGKLQNNTHSSIIVSFTEYYTAAGCHTNLKSDVAETATVNLVIYPKN